MDPIRYNPSVLAVLAIAARAIERAKALLRPAVGMFRYLPADSASVVPAMPAPVRPRDDTIDPIDTGGSSGSVPGPAGPAAGKGGCQPKSGPPVASGKGSPSTPPGGPPKGGGKVWGGSAPIAQGKGKGQPAPAAGKGYGEGWRDWTEYPVPATTPGWNAGYARRERNWPNTSPGGRTRKAPSTSSATSSSSWIRCAVRPPGPSVIVTWPRPPSGATGASRRSRRS